MLRRAAGQLWHLVSDSRDGDLSASKTCTLLFCLVFTYKMLHDLPDDAMLWLAYGGLVGGIDIAKRAIAARFSAPEAQP